MFISKFDLYDSKWIDLVFENRNKAYGAYDLRKHYAQNLYKAFGFAALFFTSIIALSYLLSNRAPKAKLLVNHPQKQVEYKIVEPVAEKPVTSKTGINMAKQLLRGGTNAPAHLVYTPTSKPLSVGENINHPGINDQFTHQDNLKPGSAEIAVDNPVDIKLLQQLPQPYNGVQGWADFLKSNIIYPPDAKQAGLMGKVWLSFIIERDGSISNITVEKSAGSQFDDEAMRVLKLAPHWQPGIQNGQAVRVKYALPIHFKIVK